ncbi:MAG: penicillin-binding protein 1C [Bacteroidota bacterium]
MKNIQHIWFPIFLILFISLLSIPLPEEDFRKESVHSLRVVDRNGILLREFLNDDQGRGQWRSLNEMSPFLTQATIAIEDRRFRMHPGIDPLAITRAAWQNISRRRLHSGGSTITQQVIRNVYHHPRTLFSKIIEAWYALRLETMASKDEILEQYLNRVPYGNGLIGAEAAARHYFDKPVRDLSLAEAAFLAGLPNAPSSLNPYTYFQDAIRRQRFVLRAMATHGRITRAEEGRARQQPIVLVSPGTNFRAPHLVEMAAARSMAIQSATLVRTTIDYEIQKNIEWLVRGHLKQLQNKSVTNASVVVIDNRTMEVHALVGSADYFDPRIQGQVNGVLARRQPGSAVKPFTYALAFEGPFTAADVVPDIPTRIPDQQGDYIPENYDRRYHGPVRLRFALACSYNVPAVRVLQVVGRENLLQRMISAGLTTLEQPSVFYGYGLTLGNGEVTLFQVTQAYAAFANNGVLREASYISSVHSIDGSVYKEPAQEPRRVFAAESSWLVTDILRDADARRPAFGHAFRFPFDCAVKTGTTKDYRDNWTVGYTTNYTVGVWVGNFDGKPMKGVSGVTGAGQIFEDVMMSLHVSPAKNTPPRFVAPAGMIQKTVCSVSGSLPNPLCTRTIQEWFEETKVPTTPCTIHRLFQLTTSSGEQVEKVFEILPEEYRLWADEQGLPHPPPDAYPVSARNEHDHQSRLTLVAPSHGQIFKVDPVLRKEYQAIRVLANVSPGISNVRLRVGADEKPYESGGIWWQLRKGKHAFSLIGTQNGDPIQSDEVVITVD